MTCGVQIYNQSLMAFMKSNLSVTRRTTGVLDSGPAMRMAMLFFSHHD